MMQKLRKHNPGFGLIGIIIVAAMIAAVAGGGLYYREVKNQQNLQKIGDDKIKEAEELKKKIEERMGSSETGAVDTTDDWKTYHIGDEGFEGTSKAIEFRYPPTWNVISSDVARVIIADPDNTNTRRISVFKQDTNPEGELRDVNNIHTSSAYQFLSIQGKKLAGESGVTGREIMILILKSGNIYYVIQAPPDLFELVVSTFKFIESTADTSDWKTYRNEKYGFEVKYPMRDTEAGQIVPNSVLGTVSNPVSGISIAPGIVFIVADQDKLKKSALDYFNRYLDAARRKGEGVYCEEKKISNPYVVVDSVDCSQAFYALIKGDKFYVFVDGYSYGYPENKNERENILSTLKFIESSGVQKNQPLLTVISPNGGEVWKIGEKHKIQWRIDWNSTKIANLTTISLVDPKKSGESAFVKIITLELPASLQTRSYDYEWTIPSDISRGEYKVDVYTFAPDLYSVGDESNGAFTIEAGVPTELKEIIKSVPELASAYVAKAIDFNGDAIDEFIIDPIPPSPYVGASGNRPYFIYQKINGVWANIGKIDGNQYTTLQTRTDGYQDIETKFHNSAGSYTVHIYKWGASKLSYMEASSRTIGE